MNDTSLIHVTDSNAPPAPPAPLKPLEIVRFLEFVCEPLKTRRETLIKALEACLKAHPKIDDDEALGLIAENMRMAAAFNRTAEERRKEYKEPHLIGGRAVDDWFKVALAAPLLRVMGPVQAVMDDYGARKLAREQANAREAKRLADIEAARLAEIAAKRLEANKPAEAALDRAAEAAADAERADTRANMRPAAHTRTRGDFGAVASVRQTWKWRPTDPALIPRQYLMIDGNAIVEAARARDASGKPLVVIPGIEFYVETKMGVR